MYQSIYKWEEAIDVAEAKVTLNLTLNSRKEYSFN